MEPVHKLSVREKICFGLGDSSANIFLGMTMMFLPYFYTDVLGISAAAMGLLFVIARLVDAFYDPFIGNVADRLQTRHGHYRPWLLWLAVPYGLSCLLVFLAPDFSPTGKLVYAYATYLFLILMYASTVVPYVALLSALTSDPQERLAANAWRFPLAKMSFLICSVTVPMFVAWYGKDNEAQAYMVAMSMIAVLATAMMLSCFFGTKERVKPASLASNVSFKQQLRISLSARPVVIFYIFKITSSIAFVIKGSATIYFVKYFLGRSDGFVSGLLSATAIAGIIAPMIALQLIKRKKVSALGTLKLAQAGGCIAALALFFVSPDNIWLAVALLVVSVLLAEIGAITAWALPSECADYCERKSGLKMSGFIAAGTLFTMKIGLAIAGGLVGFILSMSGYHAGVAITPEILKGIIFLIAGVPAIFHGISVVLLMFFNLDDSQAAQAPVSQPHQPGIH
ncbi:MULTISPECIES: glycoside-pentoside-hexuronide (GPH):cation symporter [unclassified Erwinia]|uniref:glycoside-pentoside-hexuronide (GPH):cation symporter n=1 Tax=unclassified Erwinia TaxID=2622719 RepID=UPI00190987A2|nr:MULTISPECIES: MFS transporter [unclassified Erwinia]MBK0003753.1 MFS transporter [Erwinia sp. S38]MCW1873088.1 MFS transporter [Erwinia sp. INIA01]